MNRGFHFVPMHIKRTQVRRSLLYRFVFDSPVVDNTSVSARKGRRQKWLPRIQTNTPIPRYP